MQNVLLLNRCVVLANEAGSRSDMENGNDSPAMLSGVSKPPSIANNLQRDDSRTSVLRNNLAERQQQHQQKKPFVPLVPIEPLTRLPQNSRRLPHSERQAKGSHVSLSKADKETQQYSKALELLAKDPNHLKEVNLGKRVGFYKLAHELGSGNFSKVKLGMHVLTKEKVAVKIMERSKMDQKAMRLLNREIQNMEEMHHPNVIRLFEVVETLSKMYLVLEYAGGGELYSYVLEKTKLPEREAARLFAQVTAAVIHLHTKGIIHRDIKPENVFFAGKDWVKLGDFGFSVCIEPGTFLKTFCGSPPYAAPELFKDQEYQGEYVDIWALGIMLYFLLTGTTPFRGETVAALKKQILDAFFTIPEHVTPFGQDLINGILRTQPNSRYNFGDIMPEPTPEQLLRRNGGKPMSASAPVLRGDILRIQDHYWLNRCRFPEDDDWMAPYPDEDDLKTIPLAPMIYDRLNNFGITMQQLKDSAKKGAKNSIVGTYRIVTFMVAREDAEKKGKHNPIAEHDEESDFEAHKTSFKKTSSKACTIL